MARSLLIRGTNGPRAGGSALVPPRHDTHRDGRAVQRASARTLRRDRPQRPGQRRVGDQPDRGRRHGRDRDERAQRQRAAQREKDPRHPRWADRDVARQRHRVGGAQRRLAQRPRPARRRARRGRRPASATATPVTTKASRLQRSSTPWRWRASSAKPRPEIANVSASAAPWMRSDAIAASKPSPAITAMIAGAPRIAPSAATPPSRTEPSISPAVARPKRSGADAAARASSGKALVPSSAGTAATMTITRNEALNAPVSCGVATSSQTMSDVYRYRTPLAVASPTGTRVAQQPRPGRAVDHRARDARPSTATVATTSTTATGSGIARNHSSPAPRGDEREHQRGRRGLAADVQRGDRPDPQRALQRHGRGLLAGEQHAGARRQRRARDHRRVVAEHAATAADDADARRRRAPPAARAAPPARGAARPDRTVPRLRVLAQRERLSPRSPSAVTIATSAVTAW